MILEYFILPVQHRDSDAPPRSNRSTFYTLCSMGQYLSPEPLAGEIDDQAFLVPFFPKNRSGEGINTELRDLKLHLLPHSEP